MRPSLAVASDAVSALRPLDRVRRALAGADVRRRLGALGAIPVADGLVQFRVWTPDARRVEVRVRGGVHELEQEGDGTWSAVVIAEVGDDYVYALDGGRDLPDPCSRFQPEGIRGPSRVVDISAFEIAPFGGVALGELVLYELHVGTCTQEGTFDAAIPHLRGLRELGVTAVELMPVATFPGERNWGYDGVYTYAPHAAYGGPEGLARLVDAAHREGLAVVLDVVYNHIGPGAEAIGAFAPYFTDRHETFWGDALDYEQDGVREWALQNAEQWIRDYGIDGLRLDAVHAVFDDSPTHVLAELAQRVKAVDPRALVMSEIEIGDWRPLEEWGHDAQWFDVPHHVLHVALTGETDGYYGAFGRDLSALRGALTGAGHSPPQLIVCAQNHDQVGNRPAGDRLPPDALRCAAAIVLFSPCTPLLFMGEEYAESNPFQFFTDHIDPQIAKATREGRRREFTDFAGFSADDVPDPQAEKTFLRSKLSRRVDAETLALYERLLRLRRDLPRETAVEIDGKVVRMRRGGAELVVDLDAKTVALHA
jgi:maltooligosyltrehalose trehalohydrolase